MHEIIAAVTALSAESLFTCTVTLYAVPKARRTFTSARFAACKGETPGIVCTTKLANQRLEPKRLQADFPSTKPMPSRFSPIAVTKVFFKTAFHLEFLFEVTAGSV